jgi:iron complex transport system substrate-binding protein
MIKETEKNTHENNHFLQIDFAKGFTIEYKKDHKVVRVPEPWKNASKEIVYILIPRGSKINEEYPGAEIIFTPVKEVACYSTSHIPLLEMIGEINTLTGFPQTDLISSEVARKRIDQGDVLDLGSDLEVDTEKLIDLNPEMLMVYSMGFNTSKFDIVKKANIPVIYNADFLEEHPLGRAEWIKFSAAFFDKEYVADSVYNSIKTEYLRLLKIAEKAKLKPSVYCGNLYGDIWYMPGGKSWPSKFLQDAGADYLWKEDSTKGSLELSFEAVLERAIDADFWINLGSFSSLKEINSVEHRYTTFQAFKNRKVFNYNAQRGAKGGMIYLELGYARPDLILADLIKIIHPELLPDHELFFYHRLL